MVLQKSFGVLRGLFESLLERHYPEENHEKRKERKFAEKLWSLALEKLKVRR